MTSPSFRTLLIPSYTNLTPRDSKLRSARVAYVQIHSLPSRCSGLGPLSHVLLDKKNTGIGNPRSLDPFLYGAHEVASASSNTATLKLERKDLQAPYE